MTKKFLVAGTVAASCVHLKCVHPMCFDEYTIRQPRIIRMAHLRPKTCDGHQKLLVTGNTFYQKLLIASNTFHVADRKMAQIEERESLMEREENAAKRK